MNLKEKLLLNLRNVPGWFTNRKIIVVESDDWGSIRMPSRESFQRLKNCGIDLESMDYSRYNLYDNLEGREDLERLFEVLSGVRDKNGNHCVITAISVVANPDFTRIKQDDFQNYYYEPFTVTLNKYNRSSNTFKLWQEGILNQLFVAEFHGREHLNVTAWMKLLKNKDYKTCKAFNEEMWGIAPEMTSLPLTEIQAAFQITDMSDLQKHREILIDGLDLFEKIFGYRARYFVPPNGPINNSLNKIIADKGIRFRSASKIQNECIGPGKYRKVVHWLGKRDTSGIRYMTRNCFFEPSGHPEIEWIDTCLSEVAAAFRWGKPAIISSHRVNYIGSLYPENRDDNLQKLKELLRIIIKTWPDVEFMTTTDLGNLIAGEPPEQRRLGFSKMINS